MAEEGEPGADPVVQRVVAAAASDERTVLEAFLDCYRDVMVRKLDGLGEDDARRRLVASSTTLVGLVAHLRVIEMNWFQRTLAQVPAAELPVAVDWGAPDTAATFGLVEGDTVADVVAAYRDQCDLSRTVAAGHALDDTVAHDELGRVSLRWIYVHMIDETARHAGHADILREQIDGRTGFW